MNEASPRPETAVTGWHAHVYYDPKTTRDRAARLRDWVAVRFPTARLGRWHDAPIGPHTAAMYQIAFANELFPALAPFLALNRAGLSVLIHPETGHEYADHVEHAFWLGAPVEIDGSVLRHDPE